MLTVRINQCCIEYEWIKLDELQYSWLTYTQYFMSTYEYRKNNSLLISGTYFSLFIRSLIINVKKFHRKIKIWTRSYESNIFRMSWVWCQYCTHNHCNLYVWNNVVMSTNESKYLNLKTVDSLILKISWVLMSSEKTIYCWSLLENSFTCLHQ